MDLREELEKVTEEVESSVNTESVISEAPPVEDAPPMDSSDNVEDTPSDQQMEKSAPSDVAEPVDGGPSKEGSATPSGEADEVKSITDVVEDQPEQQATSLEPVVSNDPFGKAPASWKGDAKQLWEGLPNDVKSEISRRERQVAVALQENASQKNQIRAISDTIMPHSDLINANYGGDAMKAIGGLLNVERALTSGNPATKAQIVAKIIQDFAVDINSLDSLLAGQPLPENVKQQNDLQQAVNQAVAPLTSYIQQQQARDNLVRERQSQQTNLKIQEMAADHVNFPYFDEVREDMADVIEFNAGKGIEITLEEAYNRAVLMNGRTANASVQRNTVENGTQKALKAHQEAQAAKGASVSVSGSPSSTGPSTPSDTSDLRSVITHVMGEQGKRV